MWDKPVTNRTATCALLGFCLGWSPWPLWIKVSLGVLMVLLMHGDSILKWLGKRGTPTKERRI